MTVHPAKTQTSLGICPVWSVFAVCSMGSSGPRFLYADSEDWSDWADAQAESDRMPRLIRVFTGRTGLCWFCREVAQILCSWFLQSFLVTGSLALSNVWGIMPYFPEESNTTQLILWNYQLQAKGIDLIICSGTDNEGIWWLLEDNFAYWWKLSFNYDQIPSLSVPLLFVLALKIKHLCHRCYG